MSDDTCQYRDVEQTPALQTPRDYMKPPLIYGDESVLKKRQLSVPVTPFHKVLWLPRCGECLLFLNAGSFSTMSSQLYHLRGFIRASSTHPTSQVCSSGPNYFLKHLPNHVTPPLQGISFDYL